MAENSKISWTDHTFNPWIGCTRVSEACRFCYAERLADRFPHWPKWGPGVTRMLTSDANWRKPLQWNKRAAATGVRERVFCASLADVFDADPGVDPQWRERLWRLIACTPYLDWLLLTKRPENIQGMLPEFWPLQNVWLGTSVEDSATYLKRWDDMLKVSPRPAVRFISAEPLLGRLSFMDCTHYADVITYPDWTIVGGESGPANQIRLMEFQHARTLIHECAAYDIPVWFKQWGDYRANPAAKLPSLDPVLPDYTPTTLRLAQEVDPEEKGGSLFRGQHIHQLPVPVRVA